jgi:putative nucleotidyltransferase with HDIG domain
MLAVVGPRQFTRKMHNARNGMDKFDLYIERVKHLPPAPAIATQIRSLAGDPNRDTDRLAELISYDPSLTAEVLKRSNSAFFRGIEPAADAFEAVSRLGFNEVQYVVATSLGSHATPRPQAGEALDADSLWRHSAMTALATATLAGQALEPETKAFTAGLLHDVGKLVFATVQGASYADILRRAGSSGLILQEAEAVHWGVTHAEVGARLLTRWGLPASVTVPILHHHDPPSAAAPYERLTAAIHLANRMAHQLAGDEAAAPDRALGAQEAMILLQLTEQDLPTLIEQIRERLRRAQGVLQITV